MHLINVHHALCWETLVRVVDSFDSYESCPCDTTRCWMEKCISLAGLRMCSTRCMLRDACPSCGFVRFVWIVPMWYNPLSSGEMHLIDVQHAICWETHVRVVDSFDSYESCPCDRTRCRVEKCISLMSTTLNAERRLSALWIRSNRACVVRPVVEWRNTSH